jgi:DNA-binding CsgD family transcriptional regulator
MQEKELALQYDLIGRLYEAALHEEHWPGLCEDIAAAIGANGANGANGAGSAAALLQASAGAVAAVASEDNSWMGVLQPHLERALKLRDRLAHNDLAEHCSVAALDALATAVVLLDGSLTVLYANGAAGLVFGAESPLQLRGARLAQTASRGAQTLAHMVRRAVRCLEPDSLGGPAQGTQSLCLPRSGRLPLTLSVAPFMLAGGAAGGRACAIVMARDPEAVTASAAVLQQLFELTPAEAAVSCALAAGASLEDIAAASRVSVNTVKTHLHRVYGKTSTRRQGELIALIHGSTATLLPPHSVG